MGQIQFSIKLSLIEQFENVIEESSTYFIGSCSIFKIVQNISTNWVLWRSQSALRLTLMLYLSHYLILFHWCISIRTTVALHLVLFGTSSMVDDSMIWITIVSSAEIWFTTHLLAQDNWITIVSNAEIWITTCARHEFLLFLCF